VKTDLRNLETAEEAYFSDYATYTGFSTLQTGNSINLSPGNTMSATGVSNGYTATATNNTISSGIKTCTVQAGAGAASTVDQVIVCS